MKIKKVVALVLLSASSSAFADMNRNQLDQISRTESAWQGTTLQSQGPQGGASVYVTDRWNSSDRADLVEL